MTSEPVYKLLCEWFTAQAAGDYAYVRLEQPKTNDAGDETPTRQAILDGLFDLDDLAKVLASAFTCLHGYQESLLNYQSTRKNDPPPENDSPERMQISASLLVLAAVPSQEPILKIDTGTRTQGSRRRTAAGQRIAQDL